METSNIRKRMPVSALFDAKIVMPAIGSAFVKLDPRLQVHNPVMFIVELGSVITTVLFFKNSFDWFTGIVAFWLWLTVLFANFAEAIAEGRGKAQASALRATRTTTAARLRDGREVPA